MSYKHFFAILCCLFAFNRAIAAETSSAPSATPEISISVWGKNMLIENSALEKIIAAQPGNKILIRLDVHNNTDEIKKDTTVFAVLSPKISFLGNVLINGEKSSANPLNGIKIPQISGKQIATITFEAEVKPDATFNFGQNELINSAFVKNDKIPIVDFIKINVWKTAIKGSTTGPNTPSTLSTGFGDRTSDFFAIPFTLAIICAWFFRGQILAYCFGASRRIQKNISTENLSKKIKQIG